MIYFKEYRLLSKILTTLNHKEVGNFHISKFGLHLGPCFVFLRTKPSGTFRPCNRLRQDHRHIKMTSMIKSVKSLEDVEAQLSCLIYLAVNI